MAAALFIGADLCSGSISNDPPVSYSHTRNPHTEKEKASRGKISALLPSGNLTAKISAFFFQSGKIGLTPNLQTRSEQRGRACVSDCSGHFLTVSKLNSVFAVCLEDWKTFTTFTDKC